MTDHKPILDKRYLLVFAIFAVAVYVLLPQFSSFRNSLYLLRQPDTFWLTVALLANTIAYFAAAATYKLLAFKRLAYYRTVAVQLAAMFINRLLPAGVGGLSVNFLYLRRNRHTKIQAATVAAVNNLTGFIGHAMIVAISLLAAALLNISIGDIRLPNIPLQYLFAAIFIALIFSLAFTRSRFHKLREQIKLQLASYRHHRIKLLLALGSSICLTLSNIVCLYASSAAVGVHFSLATAVIIFSFGVALGTAVPTPGGLGGFEAGLVGGMVAYHIPTSHAVAAALLCRLISYWLSLLVGAVMFVVSQRRHWLTI